MQGVKGWQNIENKGIKKIKKIFKKDLTNTPLGDIIYIEVEGKRQSCYPAPTISQKE